MKKGGTRAVSTKKSTQEPKESWRKWILTLLALGFALLVITMLSQQNKLLSQTIKSTTAQENTTTPVAGSEHEAGNFETISEKIFPVYKGGKISFEHQCKGIIKTIVPAVGGSLADERVVSYCVGENQLVYTNATGEASVVSTLTSTSIEDAPAFSGVEHVPGNGLGTFLISFGVVPCSFSGDECGIGGAWNHVTLALNPETDATRTIVNFPTFGEALWNNSGTKAILPAVQVRDAGCEEKGIIGYDLATDTVTTLTDRRACAEETLGSSTDIEGNPLPAWGPVVWISDATFTATILEIDGTWTTIEGTF